MLTRISKLVAHRRINLLAVAAMIVLATMSAAGTGHAAAGERWLTPGQQLNPGEQLVSADGRFVLQMQHDGNLVQRAPGNEAVWATGTSVAGSIVRMQPDGNVVVIAPGNEPVWATGTDSFPDSTLELQDDGNLVAYSPGRVARWASFEHGSALASSPATFAAGGQRCSGNGRNGWTFEAHVSDDDGLVLDESSFQGRTFAKSISVPYLDGLYTVSDDQKREARLELNPEPSKAHDTAVGSSLVSFECNGSGDADISVKAVYRVDDYIFGRGGPGGLTVTQEYRFRGLDPEHPCEPTGKLSCGRFWPSLSYVSSDPHSCLSSPGQKPNCTFFTGVRTVQRMEFRPDGADGGAINAYLDRSLAAAGPNLSGVRAKGSDGAMKYEDIDNAIRQGKRGDWDSMHQSPTPATSGPGINPFNLTPGCGECVHMHWAWGEAANVGQGGDVFNDPFRERFTDGKPEIRDGSTQTADFGILRLEPNEQDPIERGWRSLRDEKGSDASLLQGRTPVLYWEMTSSAGTDAAFPILDDYRHGGNGAVFFGGHHGH